MKPSPAQVIALMLVRNHSERGTYMPSIRWDRTFVACERHGWLEWRSVNHGAPYNGYTLTPAGIAAFTAHRIIQ